MLEITVTVLLIAWLLGIFSSYTLGGAIHLCLVLALVCVAIKLIRRRPAPTGRPIPARVKRDQSFG